MKTFVDVMLELPVDATLRDFLTTTACRCPMALPGMTHRRPASFWSEAVKSLARH